MKARSGSKWSRALPTIRVETGYKPRPLQTRLHQALKRFNVLVAHRRFGKTVFAVNELLDKCLRNKLERPRYAYIAPYFRQAKTVAWDYLKDYSRPIPGIAINEAELRVDYPHGGRIQLFGSDNYDAMRGMGFDGVVIDEYGDHDPRAWKQVIRPSLADRQGWAVFIGTPKGRNHFAEQYDEAAAGGEWFRDMFRASETGILTADELASNRRQMSEEEYAAEFECSFDAPVIGSYYGKLMGIADAEKRIGKVGWEPTIQIHTAWDLGIGDSTAIWLIQLVGQEIHLIDYIENSGQGLGWYANELHRRREGGMVFGTHYLPHDAEVKELGSGKSRVETLQSLGISPRVLPALPIDDGIQAVRNILPRCWFDAEKCKRGIEALRQYRREWDEKRKVFHDRPLHDWASHGSDAFRYLAMGIRRPGADGKLPPVAYPKRSGVV